MLIKYEIRETDKHGKGIFALENVKKGACVWEYVLNANANANANVKEFNADESYVYLNSLPDLAAQQNFLNLSFGKNDVLCLILDDGQYMNHAKALDPQCNCKTDLKTGHCFATREIKAGEQLFEDYATFSHPAFLYPLLEKYNCAPDYYEMPKGSALSNPKGSALSNPQGSALSNPKCSALSNPY